MMLSKFKPGVRVRLKVGFTTPLGNAHEAGRVGSVGDERPVQYPNEGWMVWVWWDVQRGRSGAWVPFRNLRRLRG